MKKEETQMKKIYLNIYEENKWFNDPHYKKSLIAKAKEMLSEQVYTIQIWGIQAGVLNVIKEQQ
jgi:hypothetical protein